MAGLYVLMLCVSLFFEAVYMTELILALNPYFGGRVMSIGTEPGEPMSASIAKHRIGPDFPDDANCNKVMFAVQMMTALRSWAGAGFTFAFDVYYTCCVRTGSTRYRHLALHVLSFVAHLFTIWLMYLLMISVFWSVRNANTAFSCNWDSCEWLTDISVVAMTLGGFASSEGGGGDDSSPGRRGG